MTWRTSHVIAAWRPGHPLWRAALLDTPIAYPAATSHTDAAVPAAAARSPHMLLHAALLHESCHATIVSSHCSPCVCCSSWIHSACALTLPYERPAIPVDSFGSAVGAGALALALTDPLYIAAPRAGTPIVLRPPPAIPRLPGTAPIVANNYNQDACHLARLQLTHAPHSTAPAGHDAFTHCAPQAVHESL